LLEIITIKNKQKVAQCNTFECAEIDMIKCLGQTKMCLKAPSLPDKLNLCIGQRHLSNCTSSFINHYLWPVGL